MNTKTLIETQKKLVQNTGKLKAALGNLTPRAEGPDDKKGENGDEGGGTGDEGKTDEDGDKGGEGEQKTTEERLKALESRLEALENAGEKKEEEEAKALAGVIASVQEAVDLVGKCAAAVSSKMADPAFAQAFAAGEDPATRSKSGDALKTKAQEQTDAEVLAEFQKLAPSSAEARAFLAEHNDEITRALNA